MKLFGQLARVRAARLRVHAARRQLAAPAGALLARGRRHPLLLLGAAAGTGFALGRCGLRLPRVPGLGALLDGGVADALSWVVRLAAVRHAVGATDGDDDGEAA